MRSQVVKGEVGGARCGMHAVGRSLLACTEVTRSATFSAKHAARCGDENTAVARALQRYAHCQLFKPHPVNTAYWRSQPQTAWTRFGRCCLAGRPHRPSNNRAPAYYRTGRRVSPEGGAVGRTIRGGNAHACARQRRRAVSRPQPSLAPLPPPDPLPTNHPKTQTSSRATLRRVVARECLGARRSWAAASSPFSAAATAACRAQSAARKCRRWRAREHPARAGWEQGASGLLRACVGTWTHVARRALRTPLGPALLHTQQLHSSSGLPVAARVSQTALASPHALRHRCAAP